ncbi:MAG: ATP-binding protein [Rhodobacteraceae bacterium]|nr:ATP-binding protein [Paracoccaceae bacterium]
MTDTADDYIPRHLSQELTDALTSSRIVNLVGSRQVGKTTLVRDLFYEGKFITLDDEALLAAIEADPQGQLESLTSDLGNAPLIIDEAQRSKSLSLSIKRIVDANRRKGQFVLTGSSNVFTSAEIADSLAGRMRTLQLWPLSAAEINRSEPQHILDWAIQKEPKLAQLKTPDALSRNDYINLILMGGYPEIRQLPLRARHRQYRDYINSVVERDVIDILPIRKTDVLRRLIDQMAARSGQEINIAELTKLLGVRRETITQYLDVLVRLSLIIKHGAWTSGEGKREVKNAKYHFTDSGLASALRRFNATTFSIEENPTALGGILESYIFNEFQRSLPLQDEDFRLYHWRSADKKEVDILADAGSKLVGIEVKSAATVSNDDFKHLRWFAKDGPGKNRMFTGIVFYMGTEKLSFGDRQFALPISSLM